MLLAALAAYVALAQAGVTAPAAPAQPAPREVEGVTVKAPEKDRMVCKSSQPIGSKLPVKTCVKKSELDASRAEAREFADEIARKPAWRPPER